MCIAPYLFSEKPPPCGCRHCWSNHIKYCVYCCVFSSSNLCLIGLSHPFWPLSCRSTLLRGSIHNPKFCVITTIYPNLPVHTFAFCLLCFGFLHFQQLVYITISFFFFSFFFKITIYPNLQYTHLPFTFFVLVSSLPACICPFPFFFFSTSK